MGMAFFVTRGWEQEVASLVTVRRAKIRSVPAMLDYIANLRRMIGHTRIIIPGARALLFDDAGRVLLEKQRLFGVYTSPDYSVTYPNGDEVQTFTLAFQVLSWTGELRIDDDEVDELRFFPLDELPDDLYFILPIH